MNFLKLIAAVSLLELYLCGLAVAGESKQQMLLDLTAPFEPVKAVVLVLGPDGTYQISKIGIKKQGPGQFTLSFNYPKSAYGSESVATALLFAADGAFTTISMKAVATKDSIYSVKDLKTCGPKAINPLKTASASDVADLESIVSRKEKKRSNAEELLRSTLSGDFLEWLQKKEGALGLAQSQPLSPELNPTELNFRLARLLNAWVLHKTARKPKEAAESEAAQ